MRLRSCSAQSNSEIGSDEEEGPERSDHGAQESSVPVRNGGIPKAPDGGHITQPGTLTDGAAVALPEDPPEVT